MLVRVKLEKRVEWQKLDACALVQHVTGNACEDLFHHAVRAVVAILEGLSKQETTGVHQAIIDSPGIDADTVKRSSHLPGLPQSGDHLVPQPQDIPEAVPAQCHRAVGKAVRLFQAQLLPIK